MIWFDGKSSEDVKVFVEAYPQRTIPARKFEAVSVPGRSGDVIFPQDAFENYEQIYSVYISAEKTKLHNMAGKVIEWLAQSGYKRLEDSYEPDIYRMAYYTGGTSIESFFDEFGRAEISFNCMPQRWLIEGERAISLTKNMKLTNPTIYPAKPKIKVTGSGNGTLTVGGQVITLTGISSYLIIDSETMNCYKESTNENRKMSGKFPELSGTTQITWSGGITAVEITPRWYRI